MSSLRDFIKTTLIGGLLVVLPIGGLVMPVARAIVPVVFAALCLGTFTAHAQEESAQTTDSEDAALKQSMEEISRQLRPIQRHYRRRQDDAAGCAGGDLFGTAKRNHGSRSRRACSLA